MGTGGLLTLGRRLSTVAAIARSAVTTEPVEDSAVIFAYHDVGDPARNATRYLVSPQLFRRQLVASRQAGYRFVDLSVVVERLQRGLPLRGLAAVTFDDSLVGVYDHAAPILSELGIPATVFAVVGALGSLPSWWTGAARVMTARELCDLDAAGVRVESHTSSHRSLPSLSDEDLAKELAGSRDDLEHILGRQVHFLAYPYGHFDPRVVEVAHESYDAAVTFLNGRVGAGVDRFRIPRLNMWSGQGRIRLRYHLARSAHSWPDHQVASAKGPLGEEVAEGLVSSGRPTAR